MCSLGITSNTIISTVLAVYYSACSYAIILKCWKEEPKERPDFSNLVVIFSLTLEAMVGYMEFSLLAKDEHPFAAEVGVNTRASDCCVQSSSEKEGCGKKAV